MTRAHYFLPCLWIPIRASSDTLRNRLVLCRDYENIAAHKTFTLYSFSSDVWRYHVCPDYHPAQLKRNVVMGKNHNIEGRRCRLWRCATESTYGLRMKFFRWSERMSSHLLSVASCSLEVIRRTRFMLLAVAGLLQLDTCMAVRLNPVEYVEA